MICKKCGAYNPDHATFCKVCAANLKEQPDVDEAKVSDAEEVVEEELRPRRGNVKAPDFSAARRAGTFKAAQKVEEPEEEDVDEEDLDEEEEVKPAEKSSFARPAAPVKKRRVIDEITRSMSPRRPAGRIRAAARASRTAGSASSPY